MEGTPAPAAGPAFPCHPHCGPRVEVTAVNLWRTMLRAGAWAVLLAGATVCLAGGRLAAAEVDFDRDIRPILSNNCFKCHGPDAGERKADLRLDTRAGAFARLDDRFAIVAGKPEASELVRRITSSDADERMPPADSGKTLTPEQIERLKTWIAAGAPWGTHWAFVAPQRPAVPDVKNAAWCATPVDAFVLARLEQAGLEPSPQAERVNLLRRLSLDLIGLPPSVEEVDAFLADGSPDAYARQVERLLASPHYGERWGAGGSTRPAMPTRTAMRKTSPGTSGSIAIGWWAR